MLNCGSDCSCRLAKLSRRQALRAGISTWHWSCLCVPGTHCGIAVLVIWWILIKFQLKLLHCSLFSITVLIGQAILFSLFELWLYATEELLCWASEMRWVKRSLIVQAILSSSFKSLWLKAAARCFLFTINHHFLMYFFQWPEWIKKELFQFLR